MENANLPILWEGGCHVVYDMKDGNVLKCPKGIWRFVCDFEAVSEDIRLAKKHFWEYFWPTRAIRNEKRTGEYAIVQPILPSHAALTLEMLERSPELREQFTDFLERNEALYAETGRAFDFFGLEGMVSALVSEENPEREEGIVHSIRKVFGRLVARVFLRKDEVEERVSITNLLVMDRDGKKTLRIADPTLTNERSTKMEDIIFAYCCNFLNKRYMAVRFRREILRKSDTPVSLKNGK